ncbi:hypothetical protein ACRE_057520 [Hapsidospora chrysogenum ATCC 11550]|uniref:DUF6604 domain-containing protein n=1 Tax=Hapsidospora chrysogenum (strain ATCC 11550 / CBS 779.69 / DSM 880 / IAM 14645 / JCM 23072 / IMI 49137) TaxID=857340 RepID=A0A086T2C2_HAPC1|nr:hypothetical protein ACRE_057520 [Hapsidospora chrysogenum ATCC 11550]
MLPPQIACGYPADELASKSWDVTKPKTGRLKGKERKQANTGKATHQVAQVHCGHPLLAREPDPGSDETHGYFVGVLKAVRDVLRSRTGGQGAEPSAQVFTADTASSAAGAVGSAPCPSTNLPQAFIDAFLNAPPLERPKQQDSDPVSYEAEPQIDPGEILFALLVNDLNGIRSRIQWIWSNHHDGYFDLAAAAVATNVTVSLARGLIEDVEPLLSRFERGGWGVVSTFFCSMCLAKGYAVDEIYLDGSKDDSNYDLYEVANNTYLGAYRMLISFMGCP